jgi:hypothetical protein
MSSDVQQSKKYLRRQSFTDIPAKNVRHQTN